MQKSSLLSTSSPPFIVCRFSNSDHSDICEVTAHWHVDPLGEGEGWTNWGIRIDMHTLHVQNRKLIWTCREHRNLSLQLCDALEGWDGGWGGRDSQQVGDICIHIAIHWASFPCSSAVKYPPANAGHAGLIPGLGRFLGEGNGNPLQYSCLENSIDTGAWQATIQGVSKSWTKLSNYTFKGSYLSDKEFTCQCRRHRRRCELDPRVKKIPWRRKWQPNPVFLPGKSHRQRSQAGYSPWGRKAPVFPPSSHCSPFSLFLKAFVFVVFLTNSICTCEW